MYALQLCSSAHGILEHQLTIIRLELITHGRKVIQITLLILTSILDQFKSHSYALLISRYILGIEQRGRCCFCAACPNRKMYLEIRSADEGALRL